MTRQQSKKPEDGSSGKSSVRIDKWLWAARCFKTRSLSGEACSGGKVKLNGKTAKASSQVKPGDLVEARTPGGPRVLFVLALAERRGPAKVAQTLYEDRTPEPEPMPALPPLLRNRGMGRPTKRERRRMERLRWEDD